MIGVLLLAALLPRIYSPADAGALDEFTKVPPPQSKMRMSQASATTVPWVDSNGWRFLRGTSKAFYENVPAGFGALAVAEAFAYGVDAVVQSDPQDAKAVADMLAFLKKVEAPSLPVIADIGVVDDGTPALGEVMNLLGRRNLLYKPVKSPDPSLDLNIRVGTKDYPNEAVANPNDFAARVREKLSDDRRTLRIYNTYTVLGHLTGNGKSARLHLLNYSKRPARDVRVRVLGEYKKVRLMESADPGVQASDVAVAKEATEFTVPVVNTYAVIDLNK